MKNEKLLFALTSLVLASCAGPVANTSTSSEDLGDPNEFRIVDKNLDTKNPNDDNYRTFYEIFLGGYSDSNGDKIGDIQGLINRLDYLNDGKPNSGKSLGITGIWLMPVFKSYSYHKYDVVDYYSIDPAYGTNEDFKRLVDECHKRGIKLIIDLPINHTSSSCSWFSSFTSAVRANKEDDEYFDFYSKAAQGETIPGRKYEYIFNSNYYYECNFDKEMPELNFDNPKVREKTVDIAKFWLDYGVDGFRFDAAKYIYLDQTKENVDFWCWYMDELKKINPEVYCVGEVWDTDMVIKDYYKAFSCFDFQMATGEGKVATCAKGGNVDSYVNYLISTRNNVSQVREDAIMTPFLSNHDMDRAAGFLPVSTGKMFLGASLYLLSFGNPFIYYGEEIGMKGSRGANNTDANRRLAMKWGDEDTVANPTGANYDESLQVNGTVMSQKGDEKSLFNYYKKLIMMRNANPEIMRGNYTAVDFEDTAKVGGFISTYKESACMVLHNMSTDPYTVDLSIVKDFNVSTINSYVGLGSASLNGKTLTLDGNTSVILR